MIAVLGAGAWGTALAWRLAANGHAVRLWGRDAAVLEAMRSTRENARYLPGVALPTTLSVCPDMAQALATSSEVLIATPSHAFVAMVDAVRAHGAHGGVVWACKGFERGTGTLLDQLARGRLGVERELAVISGPTFAAEVSRNLPTAVTVAASTPAFARRLRDYFHAPTFRVYTSDDMTGVQVGGALKNVLAIAVGISDGLGFGANARAALIARGMAEIMRFGQACGARTDTLMGLAGLGDLVLTCTDDQSRNRRFGLALGAGATPAEASQSLGLLVEGAAAATEVDRRALALGLELPIIGCVAEIVSGKCAPTAAVETLLARAPGPEWDAAER